MLTQLELEKERYNLTEEFFSKENVSDKIVPVLYSERYVPRCGEVLMPYKAGLKVAFRIVLDAEHEIAITEESLLELGFSKEEILKTAINNLPYGVVEPLEVTIGRLANEDYDCEITEDKIDSIPLFSVPFYTLRPCKYVPYGATQLLKEDLLHKFYEAVGEFYVYPTSIHEVLLVPLDEQLSVEKLLEKVIEENDDNPYYFDALGDFILKYDGHDIFRVAELNEDDEIVVVA